MVAVFLSCKKDNNADHQEIYTGQQENISIQKLSAYYTNITNATTIEDDWIIKGRVIANDESGNINNKLYIQDNSGAIGIVLDSKDLATTYKRGQELYIHLKGLDIFNTNGTLEIGAINNPDNKIPTSAFSKYLFLNKAPDVNAIYAEPLYLSNINKKLISQLVSLKGVLLTNGGKHKYTSNNKNTVEPVLGTQDSVCIITDQKAIFANEILPAGEGEIIGVVTKNKNRWEIRIRDTEDMKNFTGIITEHLEPNQTTVR